MLMAHVASCARSETYDCSEVLRAFRVATKKLFRSIGKVMSFRFFFIVGDDDRFVLGPLVTLPSNLEPFPRNGLVY